MRCRVASETPGWPLSAYDTAPLETPARRATSAIVGRFTGVRPPEPVRCRWTGYPSTAIGQARAGTALLVRFSPNDGVDSGLHDNKVSGLKSRSVKGFRAEDDVPVAPLTLGKCTRTVASLIRFSRHFSTCGDGER
ncbi:hypothetical protein GCM10009541_06650 [Micromonospora gifhornensis]|uniref:Uncharacterized protein n=1 Tax=Micromonospora gifhornensis TaxID=84594 RepID=A0ABQ4ICM4_9ACTN|nr:hypothetical protein Vgi01_23560 [Micromonospora gifhornensis]